MSIRANPNTRQREVMTAMGFTCDDTLDHCGQVCWRHAGFLNVLRTDLDLRLREGEMVEPQYVVVLLVGAARMQGRREVQAEIKRALNLR